MPVDSCARILAGAASPNGYRAPTWRKPVSGSNELTANSTTGSETLWWPSYCGGRARRKA